MKQEKPTQPPAIDWQHISAWTPAIQRAAGGVLWFCDAKHQWYRSNAYRPENAKAFAIPRDDDAGK